MRSYLIWLTAALALAGCANPSVREAPRAEAQGSSPGSFGPTEEAAVLAAIDRLFEAFEQRDPALARRALDPAGVFYAVDTEAGALRTQPAEQFFASLGQAGEPLIERIFDPVVMIHGEIAMVWTDYDFHIGDRFSHCGVNIFSLADLDGEWRITSVTYTVEREGCIAR